MKKEEIFELIQMFIGIFIGICISFIVIEGVNQDNCCCSGISTRPCMCFGFIDCEKEACKGHNLEMMPLCCNRYINCTALDNGDRIIWYGNPLTDNPKYVELESINGVRQN